MIKISNYEAFQGMDEKDFEKYEHRMDLLQVWAKENDCKVSTQFYLADDKIVLEVVNVFSHAVINRLYFSNKQEKKVMGRPSIGTTKKVSLTLPDDIWEKIKADKEEKDISQSELLRTIVEFHYKGIDEVLLEGVEEPQYRNLISFNEQLEVEKMYREGKSVTEIMRKTGVSHKTLRFVLAQKFGRIDLCDGCCKETNQVQEKKFGHWFCIECGKIHNQ